jgi:hypothetical protein
VWHIRRLSSQNANLSFVFEKCRRAVYDTLGVPGELLAIPDLDLSYLMHNNESGLALSLNGWVEGHVGKEFVTQRAG